MSSIPKFDQYNYDIRPLNAQEGGGFAITWPDLAGCRAEGPSIPATMQNGREAFKVWMQRRVEQGKTIPTPGSGGMADADEYRASKRPAGRFGGR